MRGGKEAAIVLFLFTLTNFALETFLCADSIDSNARSVSDMVQDGIQDCQWSMGHGCCVN